MLRYPLFEAYPGLAARLPRLALGLFPTPVARLERAGELLGAPELFVKRDDLSSPVYGGNKVRKLELLLAQALRQGKRSVVTAGAAGSNHVLATLLHARRLGLPGEALLLDQPPAAYVRRNLLLDLETGARLVHVPSAALLPPYIAWSMRGRFLGGLDRPFFITLGGSNPLSCIGYVNAAFELKEQVEAGLLPEPDFLFVALGTLGTASGLELGLRLAGMRTRVVGVAVVGRWACNARRWAGMIQRTACLLHGLDPSVPLIKVEPGELEVVHEMLGAGYAHFTEEGMEAVRLMREAEGIELDGTYTGKTFAGLARMVRETGLQGKRLLYWHTLNSVKLQPRKADHRLLPAPFHRYFDGRPREADEEMPEGGMGQGR